MPKKLLFVCLGNICRSPSAENIMNHLVQEAGLNHAIHCDSAGTSGYHIGEPPDRRMQQAGLERGIQLVGRSRQFEHSDFEIFDLILAMDRANHRDLLRQDGKGLYRDKVKMMCDYCLDFSDREVPDPYFGGPSGFTYVIDLLLDACGGLLADLQRDGL